MRKACLPGATFPAMVFLCLACSQKEQLEKRVTFYPNGSTPAETWTVKKLPGGDWVKHDVDKSFYKDGNTKSSTQWKDGQRDGVSSSWYPNGAKLWDKQYDAGKKSGIWRLYYDNGAMAMEVPFKDGAAEGQAKYFNKAEPDAPRAAEFRGGQCVSGECDPFDPSKPPKDKAADADPKLVQGFLGDD